MHLIVVRRDLTGFQHLHPTQGADGTWRVPLTLPERRRLPRVRRLLARRHGRARSPPTCAVDGTAASRAAPGAAADRRDRRLRRAPRRRRDRAPAHEADLRFTVTRDGQPVAVEPYLGAGGHLVALREGDLAFLHVHPDADDGVASPPTFPTAGRYRLFLQFQLDGRVHTAAFTAEVAR